MALTDRVKELKDELINTPKSICIQRANLITESYKETEGNHRSITRALALDKILSNMDIYIRKNELIVGNQSSRLNGAPVFPETGANWVLEQLDYFENREMRKYEINDQDKSVLRNILPYWKGKTIYDNVINLMDDITKDVYFSKYPVISPNLFIRGNVGHYVCNYEKVLNIGFDGIKAEAINNLNKLDTSIEGNSEKYSFYKSIIIVCESAIKFADRYSQLAEKLSRDTEISFERKEELIKISNICKTVPRNGSNSFHEALQSLWFTHLIIQIETDGLAISLGRMDKYLHKYYEEDLKYNRLSKDEAQELLDCFFLKCNEVLKLADVPPETSYFGGVSMTQNIVLGGVDENGEDLCNEISLMCIDADINIHLEQPNLSVRVHEGTSQEFLVKAIENISIGGGKPAIFNDEIIIPSLLVDGASVEEARDYAIVGCVEPVVSNNTNGWTNAAMFNLAKCFELALNNGVCQLSGMQIGPKTGEINGFGSVDDLITAYKEQVDYFIEYMVNILNICDEVHGDLIPTPYVSSLIEGCIEKGVDTTKGGSKYNFVGPQGVGLSNVADSIIAIEKIVYENKELSFGSFVKILRENFKDNEYFRQHLIMDVPKYGNNIKEVDDIARLVGAHYCNSINKYKNIRNGNYRPGLFPVASHVPLGKVVGALPSGRLAYTPLNDGISPVSGCDIEGPTAVLQSVSCIDHKIATNGTLLNMKLHPTALKSKEDFNKLSSLIRVFSSLKLMHVQFNVVSKSELLEAQLHPENYKNLIVRVAGYSANFVDLDRQMQDDIIARTELNAV